MYKNNQYNLKQRKVNPAKVIIMVILIVAIIIAILLSSYVFINHYVVSQKDIYYAEDFGIETVVSENDNNNNGVDDFSDILVGARDYVATEPVYKSEYYANGYPPDGIGVCTDVIWEAFDNAGYSLKDLVDKDITNFPEEYPDIVIQDENIDFRRVQNLKVFFKRHAKSLTTDHKEIEQWQPGDIVIYEGHIAIVSDKRNKDGQTYIIHNSGQPNSNYEEDALLCGKIIGHYRWEK